MAITQQFVRMQMTDVTRCQRSEEALRQLLSFRLPAKAAHLDLDWAPQGLIKAAHGLDLPELAADLDRLTSGEGARVLCEQWPEGSPSDPVYSPVTYLTEDEVTSLLGSLVELDPMEIAQAACMATQGKGQPVHPKAYYSASFKTLRAFLTAASKERQVVVSWWD